MLGTINEEKKEIDLTPVWRRYRELLLKSKPTEKEKTELVELQVTLKLSKEETQLFREAVLPEAARLEKLIASEDAVREIEAAAQRADQIARKKILDEICRLQNKLLTNDFPEAQKYNSIRNEVAEIAEGKTFLGAIHSFFAELFDLGPANKTVVFNEAYLGKAIRAKMEELKIPFSNR